ncbi:hypothetical protein UFOVP716_25 [uncultured Caudovirales phage]|uniref:Uncharacterized protein n=1 Tax=uncultured Caudovirales phage TaxID=2100421 RepID=A0A6J5NJW8_9CAUD|nr:hypothetical protein UFOVP716_25 [uncultured Caudovirales phage]
MAHYAFINKKNLVTEVIVGVDEEELIEGLTPEEWYGKFKNQKCLRTSYNGKIRYNYAGVGYTYDAIDDAFIAPIPQCGHEALLLNDLKKWECIDCEAEAKSRSYSA